MRNIKGYVTTIYMNSDDPKAFVTNESFDKKLKAALKAQAVEICEVILQGVELLLKNYAEKKDVERMEQTMKTEFINIKRDISDLKADTPTQREFLALKSRVDKYSHSA